MRVLRSYTGGGQTITFRSCASICNSPHSFLSQRRSCCRLSLISGSSNDRAAAALSDFFNGSPRFWATSTVAQHAPRIQVTTCTFDAYTVIEQTIFTFRLTDRSKGGYSFSKQGGGQFVNHQLKNGHHLKKKNTNGIYNNFL